jgi:hypothetical protein
VTACEPSPLRVLPSTVSVTAPGLPSCRVTARRWVQVFEAPGPMDHQLQPLGGQLQAKAAHARALPGQLGNPRVHQMKCVSAAQLASTCSSSLPT